MPTTIHKFRVPIEDEFTLELPTAHRLLAVQVQNGDAQLWVMLVPGEPQRRYRFAVRGTGHNCQGLETAAHVGTFQMRQGTLVFHLFCRGEE